MKIAIIISPYYSEISHSLWQGATSVLSEKLPRAEILSYRVHGALEIPQCANKIIEDNASCALDSNANKNDIMGIIALGCVIRGETYHFEVVSNQSASGLMSVALKHNISVGNGIITANNYEQAQQRSLKTGEAAANAVLNLITPVKYKY